jgi:hypothetical protein
MLRTGCGLGEAPAGVRCTNLSPGLVLLADEVEL